LKEVKVYLPELSIQQKIAKVLSDLDAKIELNNNINAELEGMAKLLYDYWFMQFDFPDTNGKPYKSSGGKMVYNEQLKREIPEGWEDGVLGDLGDIIGGSTPSKSKEENFTQNGIPWITPKDLSINSDKKFISRGEIDASDIGVKDASLKLMKKGTVLLSSRAPIGYLAIARNEVTTNQGFKSFVPTKGYPTEFIYYTLKNALPYIEQNSSGSTFKEVSGGVLKSIKTCLPKMSTIENYEIKVSSIFKKQDVLEKENQKLSELRDWLLPMLMNGQVTVGEVVEN
jgi:type I restriction enzyme S subunit